MLPGEREDKSLQTLNAICEHFEVVATHHILPAWKEEAVFSQGGETIGHTEIKSGPINLK